MLDQQPSAITSQRVSTNGTPMIQVLNNLQSLLDDFVARFVINVGNKAKTTRIMLFRRIIHPLFYRISGTITYTRRHFCIHRFTQLNHLLSVVRPQKLVQIAGMPGSSNQKMREKDSRRLMDIVIPTGFSP